MGRPKKDIDRIRDARINIRARGEYVEWLRRLAAHAGVDDIAGLVEMMAAEKARRTKFENPPER